jgi:magnesium transporter
MGEQGMSTQEPRVTLPQEGHGHAPEALPKKRRRRKRARGRGTAPGTITVDPQAPKSVMRAISYGPGGIIDQPLKHPDDILPLLAKWPVTWLNVDGLGDQSVMERLGALFHLHRLALEDVVNTHQRAKVESFEDHDFVVMRNPNPGPVFETEQLGLFFGSNYVLTFQERAGDFFDGVRLRMHNPQGRLRVAGPDYTAYALIDAIIDVYFPILERFGERLDEVEERVLTMDGDRKVVTDLHALRRDLLTMRRAIWPLREVVNNLMREECKRVTPATRVYLRDCYDHVVQLIDLLESDRETAASLMEVYLSAVSNRMNEVMKVLTLIATIFIPLTFVAGVYGMNFKHNFPEIEWEYGYPTVMVGMAVMAGFTTTSAS